MARILHKMIGDANQLLRFDSIFGNKALAQGMLFIRVSQISQIQNSYCHMEHLAIFVIIRLDKRSYFLIVWGAFLKLVDSVWKRLQSSIVRVLLATIVFVTVGKAICGQQHPSPNSSTVGIGFFFTPNSAHSSEFRKKLVAESRKAAGFEMIHLDVKRMEEAKKAAVEHHCAYILSVSLEGGGGGIMDKMGGHSPFGVSLPKPHSDRKPLKLSFSLERISNPATIATSEIGDNAAKDEEGLENLAKNLTGAVVNAISADTPSIAATPQESSGSPASTSSGSQALAKTADTPKEAGIPEQPNPGTEPNIPRLEVQTAHSSQVSDYAYSQDGEILSTLAIDGVFKVWSAKTGTEIWTFAGYRTAGIALSPDGKKLVAVDQKGTARLIDVISGAIFKTIPGNRLTDVEKNPMGLEFNPIPVVFSPDGHTIVHGGPDGVRVLDAATGNMLRMIGTGESRVLAISPLGDLIAKVANENEIYVYSSGTGNLIKHFPAYVSEVTALSFGPQGRMLFAGSRNGSIRVFDPQSGKSAPPVMVNNCDKIYEGSRHWDEATGVLNATRIRIPGSDAASKISVKVEGGCEVFQMIKSARSGIFAYAPALGIRSLDVSSDGNLLAYGLGNNTIMVKDLGNPAKANDVQIAPSEMASKPEGDQKQSDPSKGQLPPVLFFFLRAPVRFSSSSSTYYVNNIRGFTDVSRWEARTGKSVSSLAVAKRNLGFGLLPMPLGSVPEFSQDGSHLATASLTSGVKMWNLRTGVPEQVSNENVWFRYLPVSADGKLALSKQPEAPSVYKFHVVINDMGTGQEVIKIPQVYQGIVLPAFSHGPNPRFLAIIGTDEKGSYSLRVFEIPSGREVFNAKSALEFAFSANNAWLAYKTDDNSHYSVTVVSTSDWNRKPLNTKLDGNHGTLASMSGLAFNDNGHLVAVADGGKIKVWDLANGQMSHELQLQSSFDLSNLVFVPGKSRISYTTDRSLFHWDLDTDHVTKSRLATDFWGNLAYSPDGTILALGGAENRVRLFDVQRDIEVGSLVAPSKSDWVMVTPQGQLDTSRLEELEEVYWYLKQEPTTGQPLELFTRDFYEPRLLARVIQHEIFPPVVDVSNRNRALPQVEITEITPDSQGRVKVTVHVQSSASQTQMDPDGHPRNSGAAKLRLFRDGRLVGYSERYGESIKLDAEGRASLSFSVDLPHVVAAGNLDFSAYAFNSDQVKGPTAHKSFALSPANGSRKGRAYIIAAGVNTTDIGAFALDFAANDARTFAETVAARLKTLQSYDEVISIPLISDGAERKKQATKQNVRAVLALLAGHRDQVAPAVLAKLPEAGRIERAGPDDLVLLFIASHGFAGDKGSFYLLPSDLGQDIGADLTFYKGPAISNDDLLAWLRDVDARNLILVIDACHSAAAVDDGTFKAGPLGSRGLGQLAYDKGMQVLAASQVSDTSLEFSHSQHGILTYALVEEGIIRGKADFHPIDKKIFIGEWLRFAVERVPVLIQERMETTSSKTDSSQPDANHQRRQLVNQPVLFDFVWNRADELLSNVP